MQLIYSPQALPGCCFICRAAQRESYIDTEISIDMEGAVYICNLCVGEMARYHHYISHDDYKDLRASKEEADNINYELIKRVGALEESLRALANAGYRVSNDGEPVRSGGWIPSADANAGSQLLGTAEDMEQGEGESSESNDDEDLAGVRAGSGDPEFFDL